MQHFNRHNLINSQYLPQSYLPQFWKMFLGKNELSKNYSLNCYDCTPAGNVLAANLLLSMQLSQQAVPAISKRTQFVRVAFK